MTILANMNAGQKAEFKAAMAAADPSIYARRVLTAARTPIGDLSAALNTPPTRTEGAAFTSSSINSATAAGITGSYRFPVTNPLYCSPIGGNAWVTISQYTNRIATYLNATGDGTYRKPQNGWGVRFATYAQVFDICMAPGAQSWNIYVTDMNTGVRQRMFANDITPTVTSAHYEKFDMGSPGLRVYELYLGDGAQLFGLNAASDEFMWAYDFEEPRIGIIWDSYGAGAISDAANVSKIRKMNTPSYIAETMGCREIMSFSTGGTGVMATNGGGATSFAQRVANGDIDQSRIGKLDVLFAPTSLNDYVVSSGGTTNDATFQAAYQSYISACMVAQPNALIVGFGPQYSVSTTPPQTRYDAAKAAFIAAAGGQARMIWLDASASGENWLNGTASTGTNKWAIGVDQAHVTLVGAQYLGRRIGRSAIKALRGLL